MATATLFNSRCPSPSMDEEQRCCRACQSYALYTDWAQGDRVCTNCGLVDEGHLRDDRPEWREFNDADDLAKGAPSLARSGLVLTDETKYLGGLQPTTLSKHVFGGPSNGKSSTTRKRLTTINRKCDKLMERMHTQAYQTAKLSHQIRKRKHQESDSDVRPEYEQVLLQEEEDANRIAASLRADKWSLSRAIQLYGSPHEQEGVEADLNITEESLAKIDPALPKASNDLYQGYFMLIETARRLALPERVMHEATSMLCQYAQRRDTLAVRGVSSTLQKKPNHSAHTSDQNEILAREALQRYNKDKQMGSLCAAILFFTARNLGWPRSLAEVCDKVQPQCVSQYLDIKSEPFIKKKHCSRAMNEIKLSFPDFARSSAHVSREQESFSIDHFINRSIQKLELPPVAEASIRTLFNHLYFKKQPDLSQHSKLTSLCAALAYFVGKTGNTMKRLANQASGNKAVPGHAAKKTKNDYDNYGRSISTVSSESASDSSSKDTPSSFDIFDSLSMEALSAEQRVYQMRRIWDAWRDQPLWGRAVQEIEHACGVSASVLSDVFKKELYPQKLELLTVLQDAVTSSVMHRDIEMDSTRLCNTPMAKVLLPNISIAASLINDDNEF